MNGGAPSFAHLAKGGNLERLRDRVREHYNQQRPHSALADRTPAAFAALHRGNASTSMGRALQSLLIEPLECAKPASIEEKRTYTAPNL